MMDLYPAGLTGETVATQGYLAFRIHTYFGYLVALRTENVRVFSF